MTTILAAYNEADVVGQVVRELVEQGIRVYLLDQGSTDATVGEVRRCAGDGLLGVETLDALGFSIEALVRRKAELAAELPGTWFIDQDADELCEAPWLGCSLFEGIRRADAMGYDAIDFEVLNFWPTHDGFRPGDDLRASFQYYERVGAKGRRQTRAGKRADGHLDLASPAGHAAATAAQRVFPLRFLLRRYPIRSQDHGERKLLAERRMRFDPSERGRGWHVESEALEPGQSFLRSPETLQAYDPLEVRLHLALRHRGVEQLEEALIEARGAAARLESDLATRAREVEALHGALDLRSIEKQRLAQDLEVRGGEVEKLHSDLALRSAEKQQLDRALEQRGGEVEKLHSDLALRSAEKQQLDRTLEVRAAELERLGAELAGERSERQRLAQALETSEQERAALAQRPDGLARESTSVRAGLAGVESSLTGRPTAPLPARQHLAAELTGERLGASAHRNRHLAGLIWTLVRTDFKIRYHGTLAGFLWALLKPLTMLAVLATVFSLIFAVDPNYRLNLILGLFLWDFFAEGTKVGLLSLLAKGYLLSKSQVPRWIVVVTSASSALVTLLVFSLATLGLLALGGHPLRLTAVALYAFYVLQMFLIVVGFSLGASVLFLHYRDLNQVWEVVIHAGFFLAPIVYPLGILPERFHIYLYLWPPTPVIQFARMVLIQGVVPSLTAHLLLLLVTLACLSAGMLVFRALGPSAVEHL